MYYILPRQASGQQHKLFRGETCTSRIPQPSSKLIGLPISNPTSPLHPPEDKVECSSGGRQDSNINNTASPALNIVFRGVKGGTVEFDKVGRLISTRVGLPGFRALLGGSGLRVTGGTATSAVQLDVSFYTTFAVGRPVGRCVLQHFCWRT